MEEENDTIKITHQSSDSLTINLKTTQAAIILSHDGGVEVIVPNEEALPESSMYVTLVDLLTFLRVKKIEADSTPEGYEGETH